MENASNFMWNLDGLILEVPKESVKGYDTYNQWETSAQAFLDGMTEESSENTLSERIFEKNIQNTKRENKEVLSFVDNVHKFENRLNSKKKHSSPKKILNGGNKSGKEKDGEFLTGGAEKFRVVASAKIMPFVEQLQGQDIDPINLGQYTYDAENTAEISDHLKNAPLPRQIVNYILRRQNGEEINEDDWKEIVIETYKQRKGFGNESDEENEESSNVADCQIYGAGTFQWSIKRTRQMKAKEKEINPQGLGQKRIRSFKMAPHMWEVIRYFKSLPSGKQALKQYVLNKLNEETDVMNVDYIDPPTGPMFTDSWLKPVAQARLRNQVDRNNQVDRLDQEQVDLEDDVSNFGGQEFDFDQVDQVDQFDEDQVDQVDRLDEDQDERQFDNDQVDIEDQFDRLDEDQLDVEDDVSNGQGLDLDLEDNLDDNLDDNLVRYRKSFRGDAFCPTESGKYGKEKRWVEENEIDRYPLTNFIKEDMKNALYEIWDIFYDFVQKSVSESNILGQKVFRYIYEVMNKEKTKKTSKLLLATFISKNIFPISYKIAYERNLLHPDIDENDDFLYMCQSIPATLPKWMRFVEDIDTENINDVYGKVTVDDIVIYSAKVLRKTTHAKLVLVEHKNLQFLPAFLYSLFKSFTRKNKIGNFDVRVNLKNLHFLDSSTEKKIINVLKSWFKFIPHQGNEQEMVVSMKNLRKELEKKRNKWFFYNGAKTNITEEEKQLFREKENWMILFFKFGSKNANQSTNQIRSRDLRGFVLVRDDIYPNYTITKRHSDVTYGECNGSPRKRPWDLIADVPDAYNFKRFENNGALPTNLQINTVCRSPHTDPKGIGAFMIMWSWTVHSSLGYSGTFLDVSRFEKTFKHGETTKNSAPNPLILNFYHEKLKFQRLFTFPQDINSLRFKRWKAAFSRESKNLDSNFIYPEKNITELNNLQDLKNIYYSFSVEDNPPYCRNFDEDYKEINNSLLIDSKGPVNENNVAEYAMYRPFPTLVQIESLIYDELKTQNFLPD